MVTDHFLGAASSFYVSGWPPSRGVYKLVLCIDQLKSLSSYAYFSNFRLRARTMRPHPTDMGRRTYPDSVTCTTC